MKIFTSAQIKACDAYTIKAGGINPEDLMERAATQCVNWIKEQFTKDTLFVLLCGTGNNGGDGLAIARLLHQRGYGVKAFLLQFSKDLSPDCQTNLLRLQSIDTDLVSIVAPEKFITDIPKHIVVIDAILGTGLSRPTQGWIAQFIANTNLLTNRKIAIDMPSGLPADVLPDKDAHIMKVQDTLSFQFHKRAFMHPEGGMFTGNVHILDIGLDKTFIKATHTQFRTIDKADITAIYRPRTEFMHKGDCGRALIAGGSYGKVGAITLSARAALRAGAGLVTALVPGCGYEILQTAVPEVMCRTNGGQMLEAITDWEGMDAVGIGPGMGTDTASALALTAFIESCKVPVVVDADALNMIARHPDLLAKLPKGSVLTPHPKEFARLFGENTNSMVQTDHGRIQAMRYNINIVLKGRHTAVITAGGECWYNMTGNAGMATAGAGDVLTGIITGLLAQGYEPHEAAIMGVYLHGAAGDIAAKASSMEAMIAGDIIDNLGKAYQQLQ